MLGAAMDQKVFFKFVDNTFVPQTQILMVQTFQQQSFSSCCTFLAGYAGCDAPRAVFFSPVRRPTMLGIMAVMDQKNTFSRLWSRQCKLSGSAAVPQLQFFEGRHHPCRGALASHGPDCSSDHRDSPGAREQVVYIPVVTLRLVSMVTLTMEIPQLLLDEVVDVLLAAGASSTCAVVEQTVVLPQLLLLRNSLRAAHEMVFFRAVFSGTGPGVVSTGTPPPQLGASRASSRRNVRRYTRVRTTTTSCLHSRLHHLLPSPPPSPPTHPTYRQVCVGFVSLVTEDGCSKRATTCGWRRSATQRAAAAFRHEQQTVAMLLARFQHHSAQRGQETARSVVWEHEQNYTAEVRKPPTPQSELFSLEEEPGGACQHL